MVIGNLIIKQLKLKKKTETNRILHRLNKTILFN